MDIKNLCKKLFETQRSNPENSLITEVSESEEGYILSGLKRASDDDNVIARLAIEQIRKEGNATRLIVYLQEEREKYPADHIKIRREIMAVACLLDDFETAREALEEIVGSDPNDIHAYAKLGNIFYRQGHLVKAIESYIHILDLSGMSSVWQAFAHECIGNVYIVQKHWGQAEIYYQKSIEINETMEKEGSSANAYKSLGEIHYLQDNYEEAGEYYTKYLEVNELIGDKEGMAKVHTILGDCHKNQMDWEKAESHYLKSLEVYESIDSKHYIASTCDRLGLMHWIQEDNDKAELYFLKSLEVNKVLGNDFRISCTYDFLGRIYAAKSDWEQSEICCLESIKILESQGRELGIAMGYGSLGNAYEAQGKLVQAKECYQKVIALCAGEHEGVISIGYLGMGECYEEEGDFNGAEKYYQQLLNISGSFTNKKRIAYIYQKLGNMSRLLGNADKAIEYFRHALELYRASDIDTETEIEIGKVQGWLDELENKE